MLEPASFQELLLRLRAGSAEAATELVRTYEPEIRRIVHLRLGNTNLRRIFDSMDVCQSVFGNFFPRVVTGHFDLETPEQLINLLVTMARNKVRDLFRRQRAKRRAGPQVAGDGLHMLETVAGPERTQNQTLAARELLQAVYGGLSESERFLADQRGLGRSWVEIAGEVGSAPAALRMQLARAMARVNRELGKEE